MPSAVATRLVTGSKLAKAENVVMSRLEQVSLTEKGADFLLKVTSDAPSRTKDG